MSTGALGDVCVDCNSRFTSRLLVNDFANIQVPNRQFVFPHVNFTCHAYITKWIFSGYFGGTPGSRFDLPEIQIWQQRDKGYFLRSSSGYNTIQKPLSIIGNSNIVYVPKFNIAVQPGQILGLFVRGQYSKNSTQIYFFESSKNAFPYYYKILPSIANVLTTLVPDSATIEHRYIPKLSLEICKLIFKYRCMVYYQLFTFLQHIQAHVQGLMYTNNKHSQSLMPL